MFSTQASIVLFYHSRLIGVQRLMNKTEVRDELLARLQRLLGAIDAGDWNTYAELCDPSLSAFEPEARGYLVEGLEFHRYYFDLDKQRGPVNTTISSPHVRLLGEEVAVIGYIRLIQALDDNGKPETVRFEETRVWQRQDGHWKNVHFHRSTNG